MPRETIATRPRPPALLWLRKRPEELHRSSQRIGGRAPEWVQIFPYPTYVGELDGERTEWITDDISQQSCVDFFHLRGNDLVIDYEHLSDKDTEAPAAGRIVELRAAGANGLLARVEWTERARAQLERGEYYYDSPSFFWSRSDRRIYGLRHLALTNNPGSWNRPYITDHSPELYGIERTAQSRRHPAGLQLVCAVTNHKERRKGMASQTIVESFRKTLARPARITAKELRADLASIIETLPDTDETVFLSGATEAEGESARTVAELIGQEAPGTEAAAVETASQAVDLTPIRVALGADTDDPRELALAVMSLKSSSVPVERVRELESRLAAAETRTGEERITTEIARQRAAGKQITPAFEAELVRVAKSDVALALSSLTGLQLTSIDLTTQADTPAPTVDRLEAARQRAEMKAAELPATASPALKASTSTHEETLAIAREKGLSYPEANKLRLESLRVAA